MEVISYVGLVALLVLVAASVWFNIFLLRRLIRINENLDNTLDFLNNYLSHIKDVYKLERFYGDEILNELLEHTQEMAEEVENFIKQYEQTQEDPAQTEE
jgi:methyl-accepting chemotaxis protein